MSQRVKPSQEVKGGKSSRRAQIFDLPLPSLRRFLHPYYVINVVMLATYVWVRTKIDLKKIEAVDLFGFESVHRASPPSLPPPLVLDRCPLLSLSTQCFFVSFYLNCSFVNIYFALGTRSGFESLVDGGCGHRCELQEGSVIRPGGRQGLHMDQILYCSGYLLS